MLVPRMLSFVRHGYSEANAASREAEAGNTKPLEEMRGKVDADTRLTALGVEEASRVGRWTIKSGERIDKYVTTTMRRGIETAYHMQLPEARWDFEVRIREISAGEQAFIPRQELRERWGDFEEQYEKHPYHVAPKGGESFANAIDRVFPFLEYLGRVHPEEHVLCVAHYQLIQVCQIIIEHIAEPDFKERKYELGLDNGDMVMYRRDESGLQKRFYRNKRDDVTPWVSVRRASYSNDDLGRLLNR